MVSAKGRKYLVFILLLTMLTGLLLVWNQQSSSARDNAALGVTPQQFSSIVGGSKPAAFFFSTAGCSDCDLMRPLWQQLSAAYGGPVSFTEVRYSLVTSRIFDEYNVINTPVFLVFVGGSPVSRHDGVFSSPVAMTDFVSSALTGTAAVPSRQLGGLVPPAADLPFIVVSLVLGLGAFASPCVLPLLPGYLSMLLRRGTEPGTHLGLSPLWAFLAGASGITLFGAVFVVLGDLLWVFLLSGKLLVAFALMTLGLGSLLGLGVPRAVPAVVNSLAASKIGGGGVAMYSIFYGVVSLACSLPLVAGGMLNVLEGVSLSSMVARLLAFAVGFAAPLAVLTFLIGSGVGIASSRLGIGSNILQKIASLSMVVAALLVLITL